MILLAFCADTFFDTAFLEVFGLAVDVEDFLAAALDAAPVLADCDFSAALSATLSATLPAALEVVFEAALDVVLAVAFAAVFLVVFSVIFSVTFALVFAFFLLCAAFLAVTLAAVFLVLVFLLAVALLAVFLEVDLLLAFSGKTVCSVGAVLAVVFFARFFFAADFSGAGLVVIVDLLGPAAVLEGLPSDTFDLNLFIDSPLRDLKIAAQRFTSISAKLQLKPLYLSHIGRFSAGNRGC